ncbi:MAG: nitrile hydratase accessory protein [Saliniramus fredricksonii]|uniref:Nitrile hydratase accessory protein n=1 Tax=Saliniramus fredricksonii TaxID=1653334 RepID=A0A0P7X3X5_9HYPH|nr:MAG: nitrile hydratase accessory protein [Saliniramus fredricksonii]SCC81428.1 nitrile hydratase accessory protein [Saliniramus fredricksonii]
MNLPDALDAATRAAQVPIPRCADGPVFAAPWEAQAFAMTLRLHEQGAFSWKEWAQTLSAVIREAQAGGDPDDGATYYTHWLTALERIIAQKQLVAQDQLETRRAALDRAARATPHGEPIRLENDPEFQA